MPKPQPQAQNITRGTIEANAADAQGRFLLAVNRTKRIDAEKRQAWFIASTNEVDRKGTVILPSAFAAGLEQFNRHSPFLAAHMPWVEGGMPTQIGTIFEIGIEAARVTIGVTYAKTDNAEQWWKLASDTEQSVAVSVGFIPRGYVSGTAADLLEQFAELAGPFRDAGLADDDRLTVYTQIELLEVSQVSVPANSGAVQLSLDAVQRAVELTEGPLARPEVTELVRRAMGTDGAAVIDDALIERLADRVTTWIAAQSTAITSEQILEAIADVSDRLNELEFILAGDPDELERGACLPKTPESPSAERTGSSAADQDNGHHDDEEVPRDGAAKLARACGGKN